MPDKEFKTIKEQLNILESRGLLIEDRTKAAEFLYFNNYYRVSGYSLTLRSHDIFAKNATFQNIIDIYQFDYELRHILLKYIELIEIHIKSVYCHEFTRIYGATGYLDSNNFTDAVRYQEIITKTEKMKNSRHRHEAFLKHFLDELHQDIPLWAYIDLLTIYDISILYTISPPSIQKSVACSMGLKINGIVLLTKFLHSMTILRNLCAHGSRLFNRIFEQKPSLNREEKRLLNIKADGTIDNEHLYGFIMIMKRLLSENDFALLKSDIIALTVKYPFVDMRYYGFRKDWKTALV